MSSVTASHAVTKSSGKPRLQVSPVQEKNIFCQLCTDLRSSMNAQTALERTDLEDVIYSSPFQLFPLFKSFKTIYYLFYIYDLYTPNSLIHVVDKKRILSLMPHSPAGRGSRNLINLKCLKRTEQR